MSGTARPPAKAPVRLQRRASDRPAQAHTPAGHVRTAVLLGAQRFQPTLGAVVEKLGVKGRIALITAGWQERESEDEDLVEHLHGNTVNLQLHARGNTLFHEDRDLAKVHRERQHLLRHLQEIYRLRLDHAFEAEREVAAYDTPLAVRDEVETASIEAIRSLDEWHLAQCARVRHDFNELHEPLKRPAVMKQRAQLAELLAGCEAVAIAGGHVAVLVNRLDMFGMRELIGERPVFAWSAGAMAISERIVLFHDNPPQGRIARQVLDVGMGLVPRAIVLPEPERRLDGSATDRVTLFARRFAPATCIALPARSYAISVGGRFTDVEGVSELTVHGDHRPLHPQLESHA